MTNEITSGTLVVNIKPKRSAKCYSIYAGEPGDDSDHPLRGSVNHPYRTLQAAFARINAWNMWATFPKTKRRKGRRS